MEGLDLHTEASDLHLARLMAALEDLAVVMVSHSSRCRWVEAKADTHRRLVSFRLLISRLRGGALNFNPLRPLVITTRHNHSSRIPNRLLDLCSPTIRDCTRCHPVGRGGSLPLRPGVSLVTVELHRVLRHLFYLRRSLTRLFHKRCPRK